MTTADVCSANLWNQQKAPFEDIRIAIQEILARVIGVGDSVEDGVDLNELFPVTFSRVNDSQPGRVLRVLIYLEEGYANKNTIEKLLKARLEKLDVPLQVGVIKI